MLLNLREYHRPVDEPQITGLEHALELLSRSGIHTVPLAGGDTLLGTADPAVEAVVDLQGLGLDIIGSESGLAALRIGAMASRAALAKDQRAGQLYSGVISEGAARWGGSVQRNRATVGGAVAVAAANDPLVTALLACDAAIVLYGRDGYQEVPMAQFLPRRTELLAAPTIIVEISVPWPASTCGAALAAVARTPRDAPIVLAVVVLAATEGKCATARLALGGVARMPARLSEVEDMLVGRALPPDLIEAAAARAAQLVEPAGDFRGSAGYRRAMARVLSQRALSEAWARCGDDGR